MRCFDFGDRFPLASANVYDRNFVLRISTQPFGVGVDRRCQAGVLHLCLHGRYKVLLHTGVVPQIVEKSVARLLEVCRQRRLETIVRPWFFEPIFFEKSRILEDNGQEVNSVTESD